MASRCRHPCPLQFIGATTDERPLLIAEILDCSLREKLNNEDVMAISANEVPVISRDVALGLNYLHQQPIPIIHHDVSSANVLLWRRDGRWRAKLSDYGTANFVRQSNLNNAGAAIYSAPEFLNEDQDHPISCKVSTTVFKSFAEINKRKRTSKRYKLIGRFSCHGSDSLFHFELGID